MTPKAVQQVCVSVHICVRDRLAKGENVCGHPPPIPAATFAFLELVVLACTEATLRHRLPKPYPPPLTPRPPGHR